MGWSVDHRPVFGLRSHRVYRFNARQEYQSRERIAVALRSALKFDIRCQQALASAPVLK